MISNISINQKRTSLVSKRGKLVEEKQELSKSVADLGVSSQAAWKQRMGRINKIDNDTMNLRTVYSRRLSEIDRDIAKINLELQELHELERSEKNKQLFNVLKEIFSNSQMAEIEKEAINRIKGGHPLPVSFSFKRTKEFEKRYYEYREFAKEQMEKIIELRIILTRIIEQGCEKWGNSEFLTFISPLNKLIIPLNELAKIKKQHFG